MMSRVNFSLVTDGRSDLSVWLSIFSKISSFCVDLTNFSVCLAITYDNMPVFDSFILAMIKFNLIITLKCNDLELEGN